MTERVSVGNLRVAQVLYDFITNEALPGTGVDPDGFWSGVDKEVADLSPQKDQAYFCEGVAEELIYALTQVRGLKVVARGSSFRFAGKQQDARDVGAKLGVDSVLEGSLRLCVA